MSVQGDDQGAIEQYDKAIRIDPQYVSAHDTRGDAYRKLGQYERAIQDYDEAIRLDPPKPSKPTGAEVMRTTT